MIPKGTIFAIYGGKVWKYGEPNFPEDNTYQIGIPGTNKCLDASNNPRLGKAHLINECWKDTKANCKSTNPSKLCNIIK